MKYALIAAISSVALLGGCGGGAAMAAATGTSARADWRAVATARDRGRLRAWRSAWLDAVGRARASGAGRELTAQGALFDPDVSIAGAMPPAGDYHCRVFKLGATRAGMRDFIEYPPLPCRMDQEGAGRSFHKTRGAQRPVGLIFPDAAGRAVFLGTLMLEGETRPIAYGRDATRDMAGFVDRIGERRWRIALPLPGFASTLDLIELVPVT